MSLGSNLGDRAGNIETAVSRLERDGLRFLRRSSLYETEPQERTDQPWFLNAAAAYETSHFPLQLLAVLNRIEREGGRVGGKSLKGPRLIDLDILLYGEHVIETPRLTIPHPAMLARRFVLEPLVEITPDLRHPATDKLLAGYLANVRGQVVRKFEMA